MDLLEEVFQLLMGSLVSNNAKHTITNFGKYEREKEKKEERERKKENWKEEGLLVRAKNFYRERSQ